MPGDPNKEAALAALLESLFSVAALARWARLHLNVAELPEVPGPDDTLADLAYRAVLAIGHHGLATVKTFESLADGRPNRADEVWSVARLWGVSRPGRGAVGRLGRAAAVTLGLGAVVGIGVWLASRSGGSSEGASDGRVAAADALGTEQGQGVAEPDSSRSDVPDIQGAQDATDGRSRGDASGDAPGKAPAGTADQATADQAVQPEGAQRGTTRPGNGDRARSRASRGESRPEGSPGQPAEPAPAESASAQADIPVTKVRSETPPARQQWQLTGIEHPGRATVLLLKGPPVATGKILRLADDPHTRCRVSSLRRGVHCQLDTGGRDLQPGDTFEIDPRGITPEPE